MKETMNETTVKQLIAILEKFDTDLVFKTAKQSDGPIDGPIQEELILTTDCGPSTTFVVMPGILSKDYKEAVESAYAATRKATAATCTGKCHISGTTCKYRERNIVIYEVYAEMNDKKDLFYRVKAKSSGTCECV